MWIDNTVALSALVHGYVGKEDLAEVVDAFHAYMTGLRAWAYMDYVASAANIADLPSRQEYGLVRALGADVAPGRMSMPTAAQMRGPVEAWLARGESAARGVQWPT